MRLLPPLEFTQAVARLSVCLTLVVAMFTRSSNPSAVAALLSLRQPSPFRLIDLIWQQNQRRKGGKNHFELLLTDKLRAKGRARDADDD